MPLTAEQIAQAAESYNGLANTAAINRAYRAQDESHKWPIRGRFDVTERAIRRTRRNFGLCGYPCEGLEYALALDAEMSRIVNDERNW